MNDDIAVDGDPLDVLTQWLGEAARRGVPLPEAMTLATTRPDGQPAARVVLFKGLTDGGLTFFTNYDSAKSHELDTNARVALVFWWAQLERQVRVEGTAARVSEAASRAYFATRPRESQIGAWASPQSTPIAGRESLDRRVEELVREYDGREVPCPPNWGGFVVTPSAFEFWIGRRGRLHDRFLYTRAASGWVVARLAP